MSCAAVVAQVVADSAAAVEAIGAEHCSDPAGDRQGFGINSKALGLSVNVVQMMKVQRLHYLLVHVQMLQI